MFVTPSAHCVCVYVCVCICFSLCAGHYCPTGSPAPVQCPPGTNTSSLGLRGVGDCESCLKGFYCPSNGTVFSELLCLAGHFCPSGTSNPLDDLSLLCPAGSHCPVGSDVPVPCVAGSYQDETGKATCKACPAGSFCEIGTVHPADCPAGYFCPPSTGVATAFACPEGTFSNVTKLSAENQCAPCTAGSYCGSVALLEPSGPCSAGYFCGGGSSVSTPASSDPFHLSYVGDTCVNASLIDASSNDICPPGECAVLSSVRRRPVIIYL